MASWARIGLLLSYASVILWISACGRKSDPGTTGTPAARSESQSRIADGRLPGAFAGRAACAECHAPENRAWSGSDHDRAMAPADSSTVLGRFEGDSLPGPGAGGGFRFFREGQAYRVSAPGPDGLPHTYPVRYVFGVRPLQQYLAELPDGRLQAPPAAWDAGKRAWFHLDPDSVRAPDDWLHWTRDGRNWNGMCADCHSTGLRRGYDAAAGTFKTAWAEIDVSCEACHGPGAEHVGWAKAGAVARFFLDARTKRTQGLAWDRMGQGSGAEIMACARCHARRMALKEDFGYALDFLNEYAPQLLTEGVYHADGQIEEEDYEYGSFLQSRMYHEGVKCSDCHDPHTLKTRAPGNSLCTRCHEAARFDAPAHHRHAAGGPGSLCVDCHMPPKTYMGIDVRRDHSLRVPRPDLSARYGTPNACDQCHADRGAAWAADRIAEWHGPHRKPHFSELLARGRAGGPGSDSTFARLSGDTAWPAIARATAVSLLAGYMGDLARSAIARGASDREPLVRMASAAAAEALPDVDRLDAAGPLLRDGLLAVRVAAANALITLSPSLADSLRPDFSAALVEHRAALAANAYFPGGRFNLGQYHEKRGHADSAIPEYRAALAIDNRFIPARMNLAQLYARSGLADSAEAQLRECIRLDPGYAESRYVLGLLLAGQGRNDSAAAQLALAASAMPADPGIPYNLGLLLQKLGREAEAETALRRSVQVGGGEPKGLYALAWLLAMRSRWTDAERFADRLAAQDPDYPGLAPLRRAIALRRVPP